MLQNDDPGGEDDFPFLTTLLHFSTGDVARDIIFEPVGTRINGKYIYTFVFAGCSWMYYGSRVCSNGAPMKRSLSKNGLLGIVTQSVAEHRLTKELAFNHLNRIKTGA